MKLKLRNQEFQITVAKGAIKNLAPYLKKNKVHHVVLFSDGRLDKARQKVQKILTQAKIEHTEITLTAGEILKDFRTLYPLYGELLKTKADRDTVILALGGGSVGDAVGFIASTYLRGIRWIGLPTTLLAQVDSSVGGKTGVNHEAGKNLIGSFHQPSLVLCDTDFLTTLSEREIASGIGEIVKYALAFDLEFYKFLAKNLDKLQNLNPKITSKVIERSLAYKVKAVQKDELDRTGVREVLNFGHTFAHALESLTQYAVYQHGEAVTWGMRFATALSIERKHLSEKTGTEILAFLKKIPTPSLPLGLDFNAALHAMKKDKKSSNQKVRFVLLSKIGKTISDKEVTEDNLWKAFQRIQS